MSLYKRRRCPLFKAQAIYYNCYLNMSGKWAAFKFQDTNVQCRLPREYYITHVYCLYEFVGSSTPRGRGRDSHKKRTGGAHRKFRKEPLRGTKILFYGRVLKCFSPLRGTNPKTTHYLQLLSYFYGSIP